jgi:AcrR family transcriptional regulator
VTESGKATDKRVARSKAAILTETYRQLSENGLAGVSIDEISRACGVSKTTIYRHWPSRSGLLVDACSRMGSSRDVPDTGSLRGDVYALIDHLAEQLRTASWSSIYPSIIDATERDADMAAVQTVWHKSLMAPFDTVVERACGKGEVAADMTAADLVAETVGALFYRRWFSREAIDDRFVNAIVDAAIGAALRR